MRGSPKREMARSKTRNRNIERSRSSGREVNTVNKARRGELGRIRVQLEQALDDLEAVQSEEEDSLDSIPESLQNTERYEQSEAACSSLTEAVENLEAAVEAISQAAE